MVEYARATPSGGRLVVMANSEVEDFTNAAQEFAAAEKAQLGDQAKVTLQSDERFQFGGAEFTWIKLGARLPNGTVLALSYLLHSGPSGSLLLKSVQIDNPSTEAERLLMHQVLSSIRLRTPSAEPGDESPDSKGGAKKRSGKRGRERGATRAKR